MWSSKRKNFYLFQPTSYFNASFIVMFSSERIKLLRVTRSTFTAESLIIFLIVMTNPINLIIILDNVPIHRSKKVLKSSKHSDAQDSFILSLSKSMWKLILKIKSSARRLQRVGKLVTLHTYKHIVDSFIDATLKNYIVEGKYEAYNLIKSYLINLKSSFLKEMKFSE